MSKPKEIGIAGFIIGLDLPKNGLNHASDPFKSSINFGRAFGLVQVDLGTSYP
ncbi:MAG: hypothetical protein ACKOC0_07455 [Cytophagales bacterium]